jgi:hypothetical protein
MALHRYNLLRQLIKGMEKPKSFKERNPVPKYEKLIFAGHCRIRQQEREVTDQQVMKVIQDPTNEVPAKRKGRRKFWQLIDGSKLVVILKEVKNGKEAIIITTYWCD